MSANALTCRAKVFMFWSDKGGHTGLGRRVGRATQLAAYRLSPL